MSTDNLKQRAVSGALWYGSSRFAIQGITWVVTILVARVLAPSDYGLMGFALLLAGLADLISELGIGAAIVQRQDLDSEDLNAIFWFSQGFSFLTYLIVWFAAPFVAAFFKQQELIPVLRVVMLSFLINSLRIIPWNLLTKRVEFKHRSIIEVVANLIGAFSTLGMAYTGLGVWALVSGVLIRQTTITIGCQIIHPWWPQARFTWARLRKVLSFGINVAAGRAAWYAYSNADFLVVGRLLGQQALGLYTMVWQLAMLPVDRISAVVNQVAYPAYAELQSDHKRLKAFFLRIVGFVAAIIIPLYGGIFLVADMAIPCLLGVKWLPIVAPLKTMCWVGILMTLSTLITPIVMAKGRPDIALKYTLACLFVMPLGFFIGAHFGINGVCWAWLLLYPQMATVWYITTRRFVGYQWRELAVALKPAVTSAAAMFFAVLMIRYLTASLPSEVIRLMILIVVGAISYGIVFLFAFNEQVSDAFRLFRRKADMATAP